MTTQQPRTVAQKMGIRTGSRALLRGAPASAVAAMMLPTLDLVDTPTPGLDHVHLFVRTQQQLRSEFATLRDAVGPAGMLWVSWPKGGRLGTDLTIRSVIAIGYDRGMVESTCLRIDDTWSGLKFTHPRPGKVYANSYGTLPGR
ncbi:hypothetical protein [uncultured Williamsia sp.]|uniref:hypothetical protein n=1 Tax=uncultured Williamsia sp. TaxID=259311 RepID=UPI002629EFE0|nr:hypothetical protein [uncultured Williamsia sp.]